MTTALPSRSSEGGYYPRAFTLIELLLVVAVIAILAALLLPVLVGAQGKAKQAFCVNNLKQLSVCCQMYAADNEGKLVENLEGVATQSTYSSNSWVLGNMRSSIDSTNAAYLRRGQLFPYARSTVVFRCPADRSQTGGALRVRSYSMNGWMGSRRMDNASYAGRYRTFVKESELAAAGPARLWVIADEYESSIDDGWFLVTMDDSRPFASLPANRHRKGYVLSFADGHVESYKIMDPSIFQNLAGQSANSDWLRLKQVTTVQ